MVRGTCTLKTDIIIIKANRGTMHERSNSLYKMKMKTR